MSYDIRRDIDDCYSSSSELREAERCWDPITRSWVSQLQEAIIVKHLSREKVIVYNDQLEDQHRQWHTDFVERGKLLAEANAEIRKLTRNLEHQETQIEELQANSKHSFTEGDIETVVGEFKIEGKEVQIGIIEGFDLLKGFTTADNTIEGEKVEQIFSVAQTLHKFPVFDVKRVIINSNPVTLFNCVLAENPGVTNLRWRSERKGIEIAMKARGIAIEKREWNEGGSNPPIARKDP